MCPRYLGPYLVVSRNRGGAYILAETDGGPSHCSFRVLPYCWNDETPLSNHELRMDDDVYQRRQDPSVTVTFPLVGEKAEALGCPALGETSHSRSDGILGEVLWLQDVSVDPIPHGVFGIVRVV